jgi:protein-disulfide isomerase
MFGGGAAPKAAARPAPRGDDGTTVYKVPVEGSPTKGKADALVTLVEFSDYQCPFCGRAEGTVVQLTKDYGDKLRVVMKQNPLSFHDRAKPAALAALAAGEQGKYWQMHEKLFQNTQTLDDASLERYAKEIGLNVAKWKDAMKNPKLSETISKDQTLAASLGASGTPAFFINGRKLSGAQPIDRFKAVIDQELAKAEALVKTGVKPSEIYAKVLEAGVTAPPAAPPAGAPTAAAVKKIDVPTDSPSFGPKAAKVTIVEWSDFECPFCGRVLPTLTKIKETYGKDVRVIFRHQPLSFHPNAKLAAEASMAAHEQGKFWEYHDKLFANQRALDRASLEKYAQELGLNAVKFKAALDSGKFRAKVEADAAAGAAVGANGTPTFFINGREFVGAQPSRASRP